MLLAADAVTISDWELLARLAVAAGLGAAVGIERELRDREAGVRTHLAVSLGSALFTVVSAYGFEDFVAAGDTVDPTRIAAQIVTGIGFLGAGAIIRSGLSVRGLTTAASLWIVAALGMAAGAGYYAAALIGTALTLFALGPLRAVAHRVLEPIRPAERRIVVVLKKEASVDGLIAQVGTVRALEVDEEPDRRVVSVEATGAVDADLVSRISELHDVLAVRWRR